MSTENILPGCPTCKKDAGLCAKPGHSGHLPFGTWNKGQKVPDGSIVIDVDEHNRPITDNVLIKIMEQGYTRTEALETCHTYGSILESPPFNASSFVQGGSRRPAATRRRGARVGGVGGGKRRTKRRRSKKRKKRKSKRRKSKKKRRTKRC